MSITSKSPPRSHRHIIAAILSFFFCGLGQIYLRQISKGLILVLCFSCAIAIIWAAVSDREFKVIKWDGKQLMFNPSQRSISFRGRTFYVTDIMKPIAEVHILPGTDFLRDRYHEGHRRHSACFHMDFRRGRRLAGRKEIKFRFLIFDFRSILQNGLKQICVMLSLLR